MITRVWWFMVVAFGSAWLLADVLIVKAAVPVYLMQASLVLLVAGVTVDIMRAKAARSAPVVPPPLVPHSAMIVHRAIDQEQYAALLRRDEEVKTEAFERLLAGVDKGKSYWCRRCQGRAGWVNVTHPIWDGPFDEGGTGKVDVRHLIWCVRCDGPPPDPSGSPIRLPYLDYLPIRLLPELYARPAFHQLVMPVELYVAPPQTPELCSRCGDTFPIHSKTNSRDCPGTKAAAHPVPKESGFPTLEESQKPHRFFPYKHSDGRETCRACGFGPENHKPEATDPEALCRGCHHAFMWHVGAGGQSGCTIPATATPFCRCTAFEAA